MILFRRFLIVMMVLGAAIFLFRETVLPPVARWLDVSDPQLPAKYAVLMPGGFETRPYAVAALVRRGDAQMVVLIPTEPPSWVTDGHGEPEHVRTRQLLIKRGVSSDEIIELEGASVTTITDAEILRQLWDRDPNANAIVVSDDYHLRRVRWSMRHVLGPLSERLSYAGAPQDAFPRDRWWSHRIGLLRIIGEYLKLAAYAYWLSSASDLIIAALVVMLFSYLLYRALSPSKPQSGLKERTRKHVREAPAS